ncbi:MAG TPA: nitroreductase [Lactobacillus sp.]|nr:nitroreductase [Lactobacillus sp.]
MELMDLLQSRRAFREYDDQPLTSEELQPILLAAETSPVGLGKYRNHRLTVIQDPKVLKQIQNIYQAPTLIVVSSPDPGQLEFIDAGIIVHNMELAAENEGLAANYNMACLASLPKAVIPAGMTPCFAITLGHTKEKLTPRDLDIKRIPINWIKED